MNATKLTIVALSAAAILFGGCSTDNGILGPVSDLQTGAGINQANRVQANPKELTPEPEYLTIIAKVQMLDIENGCFYLESDNGKVFTPVTPKDLKLESGLKLKAEGYVDDNINFFCGNGPAFVIESYTILDSPKMSEEDSDSEVNPRDGSSNDKIALDDGSDRVPASDTEDRYTKTELSEKERELREKEKSESGESGDSQNEMAPGSSDNGNEQQMGSSEDRPVENELSEKERELREKEKSNSGSSDDSKNEMAPGTTDNNNDRQLVPSEDRPTEQEIVDREIELKKILEDERNSKEQDNERP